jgi:hypothetical protein
MRFSQRFKVFRDVKPCSVAYDTGVSEDLQGEGGGGLHDYYFIDSYSPVI